MFTPEYLLDDFIDTYITSTKKRYYIAQACIQDLCLLAATHAGAKNWSCLAAYDPLRHAMIARDSNIRLSYTQVKELLTSLELQFVEEDSRGHVTFTITKEKEKVKQFCADISSSLGSQIDFVSGRFFRYPKCDVKAHVSRKTANHKVGRLWKKGNAKRGIVFAASTYRVCSPYCRKADKLGERWLDVLKETYGIEFVRLIEQTKEEFAFRNC